MTYNIVYSFKLKIPENKVKLAREISPKFLSEHVDDNGNIITGDVQLHYLGEYEKEFRQQIIELLKEFKATGSFIVSVYGGDFVEYKFEGGEIKEIRDLLVT